MFIREVLNSTGMDSTGVRGEPRTWHRQDWLICIETLATLTDPDASTPRQRHAWRLLETIAAACGIDPTEYIFEIDDSWGPQTATPARQKPTQIIARLDKSDWELLETALTAFAKDHNHTKRGQRACQLASVVSDDTNS